MSQQVKPAIMIVIIVVAVGLIVMIGYKAMAPSNPGPRTDAAAKQVIDSMAAARAAGKGGKAAHPQGQNPPPAGH